MKCTTACYCIRLNLILENRRKFLEKNLYHLPWQWQLYLENTGKRVLDNFQELVTLQLSAVSSIGGGDCTKFEAFDSFHVSVHI